MKRKKDEVTTEVLDEESQQPENEALDVNAAVKALAKKFNIIVSGGKTGNVERLSTGIFALDWALDGGYPIGKPSLLWGAKSAGKSTACLRAVAQAQKRGMQVLWIDAEQAYNEHWATVMGVDPDMIQVVTPGSLEVAANVIIEAANTGAFQLIVIDSVAFLSPEIEIKKDVGEMNPGKQAILLGQFARKYSSQVLSNPKLEQKPTLLYINQLRNKITLFGDPRTLPGGLAMGFMNAVEVRLDEGRAFEDKQKNTIGVEFRFHIDKHRYGKPHIEGSYKMLTTNYGKNLVGDLFDQMEVVRWAKDLEFFKKDGQVYTLDCENAAAIMDGRQYTKLDEVVEAALNEKEWYTRVRDEFLNYLLKKNISL